MENKYICDICKRPLKRKHSLRGYVLCSKHMHQLLKYNYFKDDIQRTNKDYNDFVVQGDIAVFNIYNQGNVKIGEFLIDADDIDKVRYHKWRLSHGHVITGTKSKGNTMDLSWLILGVSDIGDMVVDHINHNTLDNRKTNLRLCSQHDNTKNTSRKINNTSGFIGVNLNKKRNKWVAEIKVNYKKIHLGEYKEKKYAVYARMIAEELYFQDFRNKTEYEKKLMYTSDMPEDEKAAIRKKITSKYHQYH